LAQKKQDIVDRSGERASVLMGLSLFILLLAFFIVLNAVSQFSEEKVTGVFDSLDLAFATEIPPSEYKENIMDDSQARHDGEGDSIEDIQNTLRSVLPGLDINLTDTPNGGSVMALRLKKNMFDNMSSRLIPVFARILKLKDGNKKYILNITSYVRSPLSRFSKPSYRAIEIYKDEFIKNKIEENRITLQIEKGNPAYIMMRFESSGL